MINLGERKVDVSHELADRLVSGNDEHLQLKLLIRLLWLNLQGGSTALNLNDIENVKNLAERIDLKNFEENLPELWKSLADNPSRSNLVARHESDYRPLVFQKNANGIWVFFARQFKDYQIIKKFIINAGLQVSEKETSAPELKSKHSKIALNTLQIQALNKALQHRFSLIVGGPGTGKTTLLAAILSNLISRFDYFSEQILLCAPTGRAARRMQESIRLTMAKLTDDNQIKERVYQIQSMTLHKALGIYKGQTPGIAPLDYSLILVDEVSMIDSAMMANLLSRCRFDSRIIFLGDQFQLPSVQAGDVLQWIFNNCNKKNITELQQSHRFSVRFQTVSKMIIEGSSSTVNEIEKLHLSDDLAFIRTLETDKDSSIYHYDAGQKDQLENVLTSWLKGQFADTEFVTLVRKFSKTQHEDFEIVAQLLNLMQQRQVLGLVNEGYWGITSLNANCMRILKSLLGEENRGNFFQGLCVMMTRNDRNLGIYNGDTGILLNFKGELRAYFQGANGWVTLHSDRFSQLVPALAITVHKSQGSEYGSVLMVFPDVKTPLAMREIVYTGITRAKKYAVLFASTPMLQYAIENKSPRTMGPPI